MPFNNKPDGYRYVRAYRVQSGTTWRWALYEVNGGRSRRIGTARSEQEYRDFLGIADGH